MSAQIVFGISVAFSFLAWGLVTRKYIWPPLRDRSLPDALEPILLFHSFRFAGLAFVIPGVVVFLTDVTDSRLATEARTRLLSTLSHDLKTPMTSIQMSIHLLLEDAGNRLSARQLEFLQAARDDAHRLHTLIEEMVGAARGR